MRCLLRPPQRRTKRRNKHFYQRSGDEAQHDCASTCLPRAGIPGNCSHLATRQNNAGRICFVPYIGCPNDTDSTHVAADGQRLPSDRSNPQFALKILPRFLPRRPRSSEGTGKANENQNQTQYQARHDCDGAFFRCRNLHAYTHQYRYRAQKRLT